MTDRHEPPGSEAPQMTTGEGAAERTRARRVHTPAADIYETEKGLILLINLPGVTPDGVDLTIEQNLLTIRAHTEDRPPPGYSLVHQEYEAGDFERSFTLSDRVDAARIDARMSDGVLRLLIPKPQAAGAQRIRVRPS